MTIAHTLIRPSHVREIVQSRTRDFSSYDSEGLGARLRVDSPGCLPCGAQSLGAPGVSRVFRIVGGKVAAGGGGG